jgi:hypothetical protein
MRRGVAAVLEFRRALIGTGEATARVMIQVFALFIDLRTSGDDAD